MSTSVHVAIITRKKKRKTVVVLRCQGKECWKTHSAPDEDVKTEFQCIVCDNPSMELIAIIVLPYMEEVQVKQLLPF